MHGRFDLMGPATDLICDSSTMDAHSTELPAERKERWHQQLAQDLVQDLIDPGVPFVPTLTAYHRHDERSP